MLHPPYRLLLKPHCSVAVVIFSLWHHNPLLRWYRCDLIHNLRPPRIRRRNVPMTIVVELRQDRFPLCDDLFEVNCLLQHTFMVGFTGFGILVVSPNHWIVVQKKRIHNKDGFSLIAAGLFQVRTLRTSLFIFPTSIPAYIKTQTAMQYKTCDNASQASYLFKGNSRLPSNHHHKTCRHSVDGPQVSAKWCTRDYHFKIKCLQQKFSIIHSQLLNPITDVETVNEAKDT